MVPTHAPASGKHRNNKLLFPFAVSLYPTLSPSASSIGISSGRAAHISGSNRKHRFPAHPSNKRYQKYRVLRIPHAREQLRDWVEHTSPYVAKPQVFKRFRSDNCEQRSLAPSASRAHAAHSKFMNSTPIFVSSRPWVCRVAVCPFCYGFS